MDGMPINAEASGGCVDGGEVGLGHAGGRIGTGGVRGQARKGGAGDVVGWEGQGWWI